MEERLDFYGVAFNRAYPSVTSVDEHSVTVFAIPASTRVSQGDYTFFSQTKYYILQFKLRHKEDTLKFSSEKPISHLEQSKFSTLLRINVLHTIHPEDAFNMILAFGVMTPALTRIDCVRCFFNANMLNAFPLIS